MTQGDLFLETISTDTLARELKRRIFQDPDFNKKIKRGGIKCVCCGRGLQAYGYVMNKTLVKYGQQIMRWCLEKNNFIFTPQEVFGDDVRARTSFQKLKLWNIIERGHSENIWKLTTRGCNFLSGKIEIECKVWSFDDGRILIKDDAFIKVNMADDEYKSFAEYLKDYLVLSYGQTALI